MTTRTRLMETVALLALTATFTKKYSFGQLGMGLQRDYDPRGQLSPGPGNPRVVRAPGPTESRPLVKPILKIPGRRKNR